MQHYSAHHRSGTQLALPRDLSTLSVILSPVPCITSPHTGAGDCFTAAYAVAVMEGIVGKEALRFASAAGSLCVQHKGAQPSMPSRQEVEELLVASTK
jgi:fructose-1-phosphate kinase PfkB-like protein